MELEGPLRLIHEPARLKVMALLYRRGDVSLAAARTALELTPGNLDAHVRKLEEAGLAEGRKALTAQGFESRLRITRAGLRAFEAYLQWLEGLTASLKASRTQEEADQARP